MGHKAVLLGPWPPPQGGVATYLSTLFEFLKDHGVELWTYGDKKIEGLNVYFMTNKRLEIVPLLIRRSRRARIFDCTHFLVEYPSLLVPVWVVLKKIFGFKWTKIVLDGTLPGRFSHFGGPGKFLFRAALGSVDEFIVVSEELRQWFQNDLRVKQSVTMITCLLPQLSSSNPHLSDDLKTRLSGYLGSQKRICSIGVFIPMYGFKHVIDAVESIRKETGEDIGLVLLDAGFIHDQQYESEALQQRDWITVLRNVPHHAVLQILKQSHVFVRPFGQDSYGISRVEALWCGLPVVATKSGETRGMMLYDFGDLAGLIRQLKAALFEPPRADVHVWGERFRQEAEQNLKALTGIILAETN